MFKNYRCCGYCCVIFFSFITSTFDMMYFSLFFLLVKPIFLDGSAIFPALMVCSILSAIIIKLVKCCVMIQTKCLKYRALKVLRIN